MQYNGSVQAALFRDSVAWADHLFSILKTLTPLSMSCVT